MAGITYRADTVQVSRLSEATANLLGQYDWIAARAMTRGVQAGRQQIQQKIFPLIQGGPTRWTQRGLITRYARPNDLRAAVGFNYDQAKASKGVIDKLSDSGQASFKGGGVPSGRYMEVGATGGSRRAKSFELQLRRSGVLKPSGFAVPNKNLKEIDRHGNLPGPMYTQIGSRIRGLSTPGSTQNAPVGPGSRGRTARKRRQADYFIMKSRGGPSRSDLERATRETGGDERLARFLLGGQRKNLFIARRVGAGGRGYEPVIWFADRLTYRPKFPVQDVAWKEFQRVFPAAFDRGVEDALMRRRFK
jgi:hypothetical protein